jgi:hypothetical protein
MTLALDIAFVFQARDEPVGHGFGNDMFTKSFIIPDIYIDHIIYHQ